VLPRRRGPAAGTVTSADIGAGKVLLYGKGGRFRPPESYRSTKLIPIISWPAAPQHHRSPGTRLGPV